MIFGRRFRHVGVNSIRIYNEKPFGINPRLTLERLIKVNFGEER
jgi:hypothetical protein